MNDKFSRTESSSTTFITFINQRVSVCLSVSYSILQKWLKAFSPNLGQVTWLTHMYTYARAHTHPSLWETLEGLQGITNSPKALAEMDLWNSCFAPGQFSVVLWCFRGTTAEFLYSTRLIILLSSIGKASLFSLRL